MQSRNAGAIPEDGHAVPAHIEVNGPFAGNGRGEQSRIRQDQSGMIAVILFDQARVDELNQAGVPLYGPGMAAVGPQIEPRGRSQLDTRKNLSVEMVS